MGNYNEDAETISQVLIDSIKKIEPILNKGKVNRTYIATTDNNKVILRLNDPNEFNRFKKEQWCINKAISKGIPTPSILNIGVTEKASFMVLPFVQGLNGDEIIDNKSHIWHIKVVPIVKTN
jgi:fructosamine-3-kinase